MPNELLATGPVVLAAPSDGGLSEQDYLAFCTALEASARGRAFLAEYARRNRHANTELLLGALDRLEGLVRSHAATSEADRIRQELRALLSAMQTAQPVIDASAAAIKAAKLAALIGFVQHRIESIVAHAPALPAEVAVLVLQDEAAPETGRGHLAEVPRADEPELPIPSPVAHNPTIALVQEPAAVQPAPAREAAPPAIDIPHPAPDPIAPAADISQLAPKTVASAREISHRTPAIIPEVNLFESAMPLAPLAPVEATAAEADVSEPVTAAPTASAPAAVRPVAIASAVAEPVMVEPVVVTAAVAEPVMVVPHASEPIVVEAVIETMIELPQAAVMEEALEAVTAAPPAEVPVPFADEVVAAAPSPAAPAAPAAFAAPEPVAQPLPPQSIALPAARAVVKTAEQDLPQPPDDPLALIMALSEAERIALFT